MEATSSFITGHSIILKSLMNIRFFEDLRKNIVGALGFMGIGKA